jgi:phosphoribosyl-ATP pyrophosphohydrolase
MEDIIVELYKTIEGRKTSPLEGSYTNYLFEKGIDKILKKLGEECTETVIAAKNEDKEELTKEVSDLVYHLLVMLVNEGISLEDVKKELEKRHEKTGNKKAERREIEKL